MGCTGGWGSLLEWVVALRLRRGEIRTATEECKGRVISGMIRFGQVLTEGGKGGTRHG